MQHLSRRHVLDGVVDERFLMGLGIMAVRPGDDDIHAGAFRDAGHRFQRVRFDEVVGIEEIQVFPSGVVHAVVAATPAYWLDCVSNVTRASRSAMDATISRVSSVEPSSTTMTSMSFTSLLDDARHALGDILLRVIRGDDDRNKG